jgi:hypothetical protein
VQRCAGHVLDHVGQCGAVQCTTCVGDEVGVGQVVAVVAPVGPAVVLARWRRVDSVERPGMLLQELQRVVPVEPERVVGLRLDVDPDNVETGTVVPHRRSAGSAE